MRIAHNSGLLLYRNLLNSSIRVSSNSCCSWGFAVWLRLAYAKDSVTQGLSVHNGATVCGMMWP